MSASVTEHYAEQYPTKRDDGTPNFAEYRRHNQSDGIAIIYGLVEPGSVVGKYVQAVRFKKDLWSVERAMQWLAARGYRTDHFQIALTPPPTPPKEPKAPKARATRVARKKLPMEQLELMEDSES